MWVLKTDNEEFIKVGAKLINIIELSVCEIFNKNIFVEII